MKKREKEGRSKIIKWSQDQNERLHPPARMRFMHESQEWNEIYATLKPRKEWDMPESQKQNERLCLKTKNKMKLLPESKEQIKRLCPKVKNRMRDYVWKSRTKWDLAESKEHNEIFAWSQDQNKTWLKAKNRVKLTSESQENWRRMNEDKRGAT